MWSSLKLEKGEKDCYNYHHKKEEEEEKFLTRVAKCALKSWECRPIKKHQIGKDPDFVFTVFTLCIQSVLPTLTKKTLL